MILRGLVATLALLASGQFLCAEVPQDGSKKKELWYTCSLGEKPCGWMQTTTVEDSEKRTHQTRLLIALRRQDSMVRSQLETTLVESLGGDVQEMILSQELGDDTVEERWFFLPNRIRYIVNIGNRQRTATKQIPEGEWFSTEEAMRRALGTPEKFSNDVPAFTCRVLDPSLGENPVQTRFYREGSETIDTSSGAVETVRWRIENEGSPPTVAWLDGKNDLIRSKSTFGGGIGSLEMIRSTRQEATKSFQAPEVMLKTSVQPTLAKGVSRSLDRAVRLKLRVRNREGEVIFLPAIGSQQVEDDGILVVESGSTSPEDDGVEGDFISSVPMADTTDEAIISFAKLGAGHRVSDVDRAEALRRAVNRHINLKNLSTAFASASETVRKKTGDCTEHAVLLVAALRAQGIPARAVNGLIWSRNLGPDGLPAYVWHMWTQALIDGRWHDLDATLTGPKSFHSAHIAVSVNDLSRASINLSSTEMLEILGDLQIEILESDMKRR